MALLPEGTVAFECVTVSGGNYYYGDVTLAHWGPQSITRVMRSVDDLKNGVAPLRVDKPVDGPDPASRRSGLCAAGATNSGDDRDSTTVEALITPVDRQWGPTRRFF